MDEARARELRIEEQFPDGKAGSGFSYTFRQSVEGLILLEVRMPDETVRLFFEPPRFFQFASEASAVARYLSGQHQE